MSAATWDMQADVVVVGCGGAGVAAAIEAADQGAEVLVLERFGGGGATRMSGGVMYCGGGTDLQREAGYEDTRDNLLAYLRQEAGDTVSDEVLLEFCARSRENHEWVKGFGVPYPFGFESQKTFYPARDTTLYYSGNEVSPPYSEQARPAPRGHRAHGKGMTGKVLFEPLRAAALGKGVRIQRYARCLDLITSEQGEVLGVEARIVRCWLLRALIWLMFQAATNLGAFSAVALALFSAGIRGLERLGRRKRVRARGGVVLASGGFIYNRQMVREHVPRAVKAMRLGTVACDGSGIQMARRVGAAVRKMGRTAVWLFFAPPRAFLQGIFLDRQGRRICNEEYYGATLAMHMMERHDARGILVLDRRIYEQVRGELWQLRSSLYQLFFGVVNTWFNRNKAATLEGLARKCGVPAGALEQAVARYNEDIDAGRDQMGKSKKMLHKLERPPYYAVDCDINNWRFLTPAISLGGLTVDGLGARVLDTEGQPIKGLYAAGRAAVGICSQSYVTGLAIADCIFTGRNAGRSAAAAAGHQAPEAGQ